MEMQSTQGEMSQNHKKKKILIAIIVAALLVLAGIWWWQSSRESVIEQPESIEALNEALENLDVGDLDAEFEVIDQELQQL